MSEVSASHRIRLRRAWIAGPVGHDGPGRTIDLPSLPDLLVSEGGFMLLERGFGRPPIVSDRETVDLELIQIPGLVDVRLNDRSLEIPERPQGSKVERLVFEGIAGQLESRNTLQLVVDLDAVPDPARSDWGQISLVIRGD